MSSQSDEYEYLFEQDFMERIEDKNNKDNPWVKPTDKFWNLLQAKVISLTSQIPESRPDEILAYATTSIIQDYDKSITEERATEFGRYLYTALKNGKVYRGIIRIISNLSRSMIEHQQLRKVKKTK